MLNLQVFKGGLPGASDSIPLTSLSCNNIYDAAKNKPESGNSLHFVQKPGEITRDKICIYQEANCIPQSLRLEVLDPIDVSRVGFPIKSYRKLETDESCVSKDFKELEIPAVEKIGDDLTRIYYEYINWLDENVTQRLAKEMDIPWEGESSKLVYFWHDIDPDDLDVDSLGNIDSFKKS